MFPAGSVDPALSAEAALSAFCGWHVAPEVTETLTVDGNGRSTLKLPTQHVTRVSAVRIDGREVSVVGDDGRGVIRWNDIGMLQGMTFPRRFRAVQVDLTHGWAPEDLANVQGIVQAAAQRLSTDPRVRSQSVAGASVQYATTRSGGPLSHLLTEDEREALAPYMLTWGP